MFNRLSEPLRGKKQWYRTGQLLPILGANALLADKRYAFCIEQVRQLCDLPEEHFNFFYQSVIYRFAEFVQMLPENLTMPLGSLLTEGLLRGFNTLHAFVNHFDYSSPLERYALFTACILRDVSQVSLGYRVLITDEDGYTVQVWQPFCGPLTEVLDGYGYKIIPLSSSYQRLGKTLRVLLARQIIGESGYLWIASDLRLLAEWLEALNVDEEEGSGRLVNFIKLYRQPNGNLVDSLPAVMMDILDAPATEYADQFYEWLINGLNDGTIKVNRSDAAVHVTSQGVFIETPAIFKTFLELYQVPVNQFVLFTQLGNLFGIARKGAGDYRHVQLFSEYPDVASGSLRANFSSPLSGKNNVLRDGILISDANTLFVKGQIPDISPYVKLPASVKPVYQSLAEFNALIKPNTSLKLK